MMEEELTYSTVVFNNTPPPPKGQHAEQTVYSEVKCKVPATDKNITTAAGGKAAERSKIVCLLAVCLGILCVLLLASIAIIIYFSVVANAPNTNISDLRGENQQLMSQQTVLQHDKDELSRQIEGLNWTMEVILQFDNFPVTQYCPERTCNQCRTGWILFQEKCYLFYEWWPWKTWEDSQKYCQENAADLVVIESLQEQEFIHNHTEYYYDMYHGYWIGLRRTSQNYWQWVDGQNDTLGFWANRQSDRVYTLLNPNKHLTKSWEKQNNYFVNKLLCEAKVLFKSYQ
ncbi:C-type lectin domain family 9 member A-like [Thalassophryne amazonica]|uniref:C-type lectin domain family 9 member A-like n=1 Tax=Thalassophryne amazonica TaxID=390379 RepID=UPI001470F899|nr:C-type lectin domain family 9 member A-like [Thalassophryne amazonica]